MGTRRSRHNKGRKPLYKEHRSTKGRDQSWRSFSTFADQTGNSQPNLRAENMLRAKSAGVLLAECQDPFLSNQLSANVASRDGETAPPWEQERPIASQQNGRQQSSLNFDYDTNEENSSADWQNFSTPTSWASLESPDEWDSENELMTRYDGNGIEDDGQNGKINSLTPSMMKGLRLPRSRQITPGAKGGSRLASALLQKFIAQDRALAASSDPAAVPFVPYWKRPEGLMWIARMAARRAFWRSRGRNKVDYGVMDDAANEIVSEFCATEPQQQPKTEREFEIFAVQAARRFINRELAVGHRYLGSDKEPAIDKRYAMWRHVAPEQENVLYFKDVLRALNHMPLDVQAIAWRLFRAGTIIEYASDAKCSLFEAMNEQRKFRKILNGLAGEVDWAAA